jgi:salicylate hydroxylase
MSPPKPLNILILGGGIAGLTTALSLTKFAPPNSVPAITIYEIRPEPATIGGAVNLTPNALRLLSHLGALDEIRARNYGADCSAVEVFDLYTNRKIAESSFRGPSGQGLGSPPFRALRITRGEALKGVLAAIEHHSNIEMVCGKKTINIDEGEDGVTLRFEDGDTVEGDVLIGCDGIHSAARLLHVEPERKSVYSGICNAFGFAARREGEDGEEYEATHFETSGMNFGRRGMLLTSFYDSKKESVYVGALMQVPEIASRDGWKAAGSDAANIRKEMLDRYSGAANPLIQHVIEDAQDLYLWPVFTLSKHGKWSTDRVMLIGDSAHAMPPQGESTGIVFEDGVLFARCLARWMEGRREQSVPMKEAFDAYEKLRRARIETAWEESQSVVKTVRDTPWWGHWIKMGIVPWYLWWSGAKRERHFVEDVTACELGY